MNKVQLREAKAKLSALVDAAERGETTTIIRSGERAAMIVSDSQGERLAEADGKPSFAAWLLSMPGEISFERDRRPMRTIDFD